MMLGAVLTQNTAWTNVEQAIGNLRRAKLLDAAAILSCPAAKLAQLLRPSGFFNVKTRRVRNLAGWFVGHDGFERLDTWATADLRQSLLAVNGIGPETADAITLYAFSRPQFVIDAYTRRLLQRLGAANGGEAYDELQSWFHGGLELDAALFNEFHALVVEHGKRVCRKRPLCGVCVLADDCASAPDSGR